MNTTQHSFLVGITRVIAIFFGIRSIDQLTGGIFAYYLQTSMQRSMDSEMASIMPGVYAIYAPAFLLCVALMVSVWFVAPFICRLAITGQTVERSDHQNVTAWNPVMIFLVGTLFVGWGMTRIADDLIPYFQAMAKHVGYILNIGTGIHVVISILLIGFGAILMARCATIYGWIISRTRISGEQIADGKTPEAP